MQFDPQRIAVQYYFGDLDYWHLPQVALDALEKGFDGLALRRLAAMAMDKLVASDMRSEEVDAAFREMGVAAPIPKPDALMYLAVEKARQAIAGEENVFNAATHIRIHLCELKEPPRELQRIVRLSKEANRAPKILWKRLEKDLNDALSEFLRLRESPQ